LFDPLCLAPVINHKNYDNEQYRANDNDKLDDNADPVLLFDGLLLGGCDNAEFVLNGHRLEIS
jgi:hypothetical protein